MNERLTAEEQLELENEFEDEVVVSAIFEDAEELGIYYLDNVVGSIDRHIEAVLDMSALGEEIADSDDEYYQLSHPWNEPYSIPLFQSPDFQL